MIESGCFGDQTDYWSLQGNWLVCPRLAHCLTKPCCNRCQWLRFALLSSAQDDARAAKNLLRARAAKNVNSQDGLLTDISRDNLKRQLIIVRDIGVV